MEVVIVASGELAAGDERLLADAVMVVAADGGADALARLGRVPDLLVGDLDSADRALVDRLAAGGGRIERHPVDKEASDTALAIRAALAAGATRVVVLGATHGERIDHAVANLLLLADPALAGVDVSIVHGPDRVRLLSGAGAVRLDGGPGDLVTLLPLGDAVRGVTTVGLRWALDGGELPPGSTRGLSNEVVEAPASVSLDSGTLFVIERTRNQHTEPNP